MCEQIEPEVTSSTNLDAAEVVAQLRSHRIQNFVDFLTAHWPPDVAEECAAEAVNTDCIELKLPEEMYCEVCKVYARLCREWYALPEVQERMTA